MAGGSKRKSGGANGASSSKHGAARVPPPPQSAAESTSPPLVDPARVKAISRRLSDRTQSAFLPDDTISRHWIWIVLAWAISAFQFRVHGYSAEGLPTRDVAVLYFTRHSSHNSDILTVLMACWKETGRVTRMLLHKLIVAFMPWIRMIGGVPGERKSAVALLEAGFWCGVIPGGADEGMKGHENAYRLHWPDKRVGFAKVAMAADALLVPFFVRNSEESRWQPITALWHLMRGYALYDWLMARNFPAVTPVLYTLAECVWFGQSWVAVPIPVRCRVIFGSPVPYDKAVDSTADVVARCHDALQALIDQHQPNAKEGRNYTRALAERWEEEWRVSHPRLTRSIEAWTPAFIKAYVRRNRGPAASASRRKAPRRAH